MGLSRTTAFLLVALVAFASLGSARAASCASGTDNAGKKCPPDDTNGPCPAGCEAGTTSTPTSTEAGLALCILLFNVDDTSSALVAVQ
jgi:hypothetical protein